MIRKTYNGTGLKPPGRAFGRHPFAVCPFCFGSRMRGGEGPAPEKDAQGLQDGMLAHYLAQAGSADANVARRIEKEPFDFRDFMRNPPAQG